MDATVEQQLAEEQAEVNQLQIVEQQLLVEAWQTLNSSWINDGFSSLCCCTEPRAAASDCGQSRAHGVYPS